MHQRTYYDWSMTHDASSLTDPSWSPGRLPTSDAQQCYKELVHPYPVPEAGIARHRMCGADLVEAAEAHEGNEAARASGGDEADGGGAEDIRRPPPSYRPPLAGSIIE